MVQYSRTKIPNCFSKRERNGKAMVITDLNETKREDVEIQEKAKITVLVSETAKYIIKMSAKYNIPTNELIKKAKILKMRRIEYE